MANNDEWCDLCNDKLKNEVVKMSGKGYGICSHCKVFIATEREEVPDIDRGKRFA